MTPSEQKDIAAIKLHGASRVLIECSASPMRALCFGGMQSHHPSAQSSNMHRTLMSAPRRRLHGTLPHRLRAARRSPTRRRRSRRPRRTGGRCRPWTPASRWRPARPATCCGSAPPRSPPDLVAGSEHTTRHSLRPNSSAGLVSLYAGVCARVCRFVSRQAEFAPITDLHAAWGSPTVVQ